MSTTAETAVVKADHFTKMITEKKAAYAVLTITGLDDKEGYKKVDAARKDFKSIRVEIEKFFKADRDTLNIAVKANLAKEKEVLALVTPLELELKAKTDVIDQEKQRIADEEAAKEKAKIDARFDRINKMGFAFDGNFYHYEDIKISLVDIQTCSDEFIDNFILSVEEAKEKAAEVIRVENERKAKEQAEIDAKQKAEQARLDKEKAEQERIAKEQADKEQKLLEQKIVLRKKELLTLGLTETSDSSGHYVDQYKKCSIVDSVIKSLQDDKWEIIVSEVKKKLEEGKQEAAAAEEKRLADIETAKAEATAKAKHEAEEEAKQKAEAEAKARKAEEEKTAAAAEEKRQKALNAPEKIKLQNYAKDLRACVCVSLSTDDAKEIMQGAETKLRELLTYIETEASKL